MVQFSWYSLCHDSPHPDILDTFCSLSLCIMVCNNRNTDCAARCVCVGFATSPWGTQLCISFPCRANMCDLNSSCRGKPVIPALFWAGAWDAAVQCSWCIVCHDTLRLCTRDMFCSLSLCMPVCNNPNTDCAGLACTGVATWICCRQLRAFFPGRASMGAAHHGLLSKCAGRSVQ